MNNLETIFCRHPLWPAVKYILQNLDRGGFLSYLAGGCIRDALLGQVPKDFDIATSAKPDEIISLFPNSNKQGKAFGVVAVFCEHLANSTKGTVEVATFRKDGPYQDGRHPCSIEFLSDKEDALRRDFTVNALFYSLKKHQIIDYVNGEQDLKLKVIRTVGNPSTRFQEDHLRIIRALRFMIQLDFSLDSKTEKALMQMKDLLWKLAKERIYDECVKMLQTKKIWQSMQAFRKLGLLSKLNIKPSSWQDCELFWKHLNLPSKMQSNRFLWAVAFYPIFMQYQTAQKGAKHFTHSLKDWKFPTHVIRAIQEMFMGSCTILSLEESVSLAKQLRVFNSIFIKEILFLSKQYRGKVKNICQIENAFQKRAKEGKLPPPLVNGYDLKALGVATDKNMARVLDILYDYQLEKQVTQKEKLLALAKRFG